MNLTADGEGFLRECIEELHKNRRIRLTLAVGDEWYQIDADDICGLVKGDDESVSASLSGLSIEEYRAWIEHLKFHHCTAIGRDGIQCRKWRNHSFSASSFSRDTHLFCRIHGAGK